jgi:hypothetical protein
VPSGEIGILGLDAVGHETSRAWIKNKINHVTYRCANAARFRAPEPAHAPPVRLYPSPLHRDPFILSQLEMTTDADRPRDRPPRRARGK